MTITRVTRTNLFEEMTDLDVAWWGRYNELNFLAKLYNLEEMESKDSRYTNARDDIFQHRVLYRDGLNSWIFKDSRFGLIDGKDKKLLRFLNLTVAPAVRRISEALKLVELYNRHLRADGYEFRVVKHISGQPVFEARLLGTAGISALDQLRKSSPELLHEDYIDDLNSRIELIFDSINSRPDQAIGDAKDLIESVAKTILDKRNIDYRKRDGVQVLLKKVREELDLMPDAIEDSASGADVLRRLLGSLGTIAQSLAELRNLYGTGHGKALGAGGLESRHALLAAGSVATLTMFLLETYHKLTKDNVPAEHT